ncbi:TPA: hypothetical protein VNU32_001743 [Streptococcus pyogenes]|uniref:Transposase n=1 Tax=Streptococcus pyogenes TaxID=1314 RepID=A0A5S4TDB4_STRPY|nr:hypothetical protein [Streptococcus pyogenes]PWV34672.1 hypothetical protein DI491_08485 [Streptococcus pyogenes]QAX70236.1 hypothetical protein EB816_00240 [Streptococcus pyogenes]QAX71953.1 hypothetical protein EB817_00240 [Streptococcus pyogenes]QCK27863.1 hypothetical protein ETT72_00240 [Streptococcus pyogenes]
MFQTIFKIFLKEKNKISNILKLNYSKAKLETVNNLIKAIKLNVLLLYSSQRAYHFSYRNNERFKYSI